MGHFEIRNDTLYLNGDEFRLIGGALHYFRVPRSYWRDRLEKLLMMGCNTVETIVPWNIHEPSPGVFDFQGDRDVAAFTRTAGELGIQVLLRPSPYTCGEWEFGGQPWWLLKDRSMRVRSCYPGYMDAVSRYYDELVPRLLDLQVTRGGPVLAMQVENEYGSYGMEKAYMEFLRDALRDRGVDVPLFTSDGPWDRLLLQGGVSGVLQTGNFGSDAVKRLGFLERHQPGAPLICMEFWGGWFDAWGEEHHRRDAEECGGILEEIMERGGVNFYMFHGGTNFGFSTGANQKPNYTPFVTSYDYDAPLSEDGQLTPKFETYRGVIARYRDIPKLEPSTVIRRAKPRRLGVRGRAALFDHLEGLSSPVESDYPLTMEDLDSGYGYVNYRLNVGGGALRSSLELVDWADRAQIFLDGSLRACLDRRGTRHEPNVYSADGEMLKDGGIEVDLSEGDHVLDILVENLGRVNFGHRMNTQRKGIEGAVLLGGAAQGPITHYPLNFRNPGECTGRITWRAADETRRRVSGGGPLFHRFELDYRGEPGEFVDHFLDTAGWGKGFIMVNGFNLGRFWDIGPQRTLYLPGCLLEEGENEIIVFESEGRAPDYLDIRGDAVLGGCRI